ncbi:NADPH-dependent aldehyde reductase-like protein, chloroplastic isoform X2 [Ricinus communis]|uniref:NADPH-dependent aldehyde reductase-like protein, chloroplastic isoform X2 n=1 Tax=Ricinus communis TaxID=3988 RepID=UPI00201AB936|nr:NADPH-dependent aldehyde reductase-like protein, chloroplastic isoform X2 [Ricinus communis]
MATTNATTGSNPPQPPPPSPLPLQDRVAIVTGSSRGIGKAIAIHLASLGAKLVINYTSNKDQADLVASEINSSPSLNKNSSTQAIVVQADVSEPAQVKLLFDEAERVFESQVHILVNSAAITDTKYPTFAHTSVEDFDRIFSVKCRGAFLCCKEAANRLKRGGGGRIILISSSLVAKLKPKIGTYTASKAAVETMTKILAKELKGTGITANCVAPGPIATEMFFTGRSEEYVESVIDECPQGRLGEPRDVALLVGFLATDGSEWVSGQVIRATGGTV